jgi:hypothetical protein
MDPQIETRFYVGIDENVKFPTQGHNILPP